MGRFLVDRPVEELPILTHFGFCNREDGLTVNEHVHFGYEVVYIHRGTGELTFFSGRAPIPCVPDDLIVVAPGVVHEFEALPCDLEYYWLGIRERAVPTVPEHHIVSPIRMDRSILHPRGNHGHGLDNSRGYNHGQQDYLPQLVQALPVDHFVRLRRVPEAFRCFSGIHREVRHRHPYRDAAVYNYVLELLLILHRHLLPESTSGRASDLVTGVCDYIRAHYRERLTAERLAVVAGVSVSHLCRVFSRVTGRTITQFVADCRMNEAKRMLVSGAPVGATAAATGPWEIFSFSAAFRKYAGVPPSRYRASLGASEG